MQSLRNYKLEHFRKTTLSSYAKQSQVQLSQVKPGGGWNHEQANIVGIAYIKRGTFQANLSFKVKTIVLYPTAGRLR